MMNSSSPKATKAFLATICAEAGANSDKGIMRDKSRVINAKAARGTLLPKLLAAYTFGAGMDWVRGKPKAGTTDDGYWSDVHGTKTVRASQTLLAKTARACALYVTQAYDNARDTTEDGVTALAAEIDAIIAGAYAPAERAAPTARDPLPAAIKAITDHAARMTAEQAAALRAALLLHDGIAQRAADKAAQRKLRRADKAPAAATDTATA